MDIIISSTNLTIEKNHFQSNKSEIYETDSRFDFPFSCDLQGHFASTHLQSSSGRVALLQSSPGPKLTSIINGVESGTGKTQKEPSASYRSWIDLGCISINQVQTSISKRTNV